MKKILCMVLILSFCLSPVFAQDDDSAIHEDDLVKVNLELKSMAKGIGIGLAVSGAATAIGILTAATVESIARQPEAADSLNSAMNTGVYACVGIAIATIAATYLF